MHVLIIESFSALSTLIIFFTEQFSCAELNCTLLYVDKISLLTLLVCKSSGVSQRCLARDVYICDVVLHYMVYSAYTLWTSS